MSVLSLFENELERRGLSFAIDSESGRHVIETAGERVLVCLDNLQRDVARDGDIGRVSRFIDSILPSSALLADVVSADQLYWCLEPSDYHESADFRVALSEQVDRVLVHLSADRFRITWVTPGMLDNLGITESEAGAKAFENLAQALREAKIESQDINGVMLGYIGTALPFKSSLMLAPNLREVVGNELGWPLLAVAPNRDFLYLWAAQHTDFVQRVGGVVVREYSQASYPISTEVYEITGQGLRAVGEFPKNAQ